MSVLGAIGNASLEFALNQLNSTQNLTQSLQKQLSSGKAINGPADNPAGYAISQGFTTQINGMNQAIQNANQGVSLLQTATGALGQQTNILQKMRTIAVQAANGTNNTSDRSALQATIQQLSAQIDTIGGQTQFNGIHLLNGTAGEYVGEGSSGAVATSSSTGATGGGTSTTSGSSGATGYILQPWSSPDYTTNGSLVNGNNYYGYNEGTYTSTTQTSKNFTINGALGSANVTVSHINTTTSPGINGGHLYSQESVYDVANAINSVAGSTGVTAKASNVSTWTPTAGTYNFKLQIVHGSGGSGALGSTWTNTSVSATVGSDTKSGITNLVNAINTAGSGIGVSATLNSKNQIVITQSSGYNVRLKNFTGTGSLADSAGTVSINASSSSDVIHGSLKLSSASPFSLSSGVIIGFGTNSAITSKSASSTSSSTSTSPAGSSGALINKGIRIQFGPNSGQHLNLNLESSLIKDMGLSNINVMSSTNAQAAISSIDKALSYVNGQSARLGAYQQRLRSVINANSNTATNEKSSLSVIRDANIMGVSTKLSKQRITQDAGIHVLANERRSMQAYLKLIA